MSFPDVQYELVDLLQLVHCGVALAEYCAFDRWVGCMAHGVQIVQSSTDLTSLDRASAEWYLSGKFGSHWPEVMGHDQAGT